MELNTGSSFTVFWSNLNLESLPFFQGGGGMGGGGSRDPKNGTLKQRRDPKPPSFYRSTPLLYPVYHAINTNTFSFENA